MHLYIKMCIRTHTYIYIYPFTPPLVMVYTFLNFLICEIYMHACIYTYLLMYAKEFKHIDLFKLLLVVVYMFLISLLSFPVICPLAFAQT
jgi:hypothetical protein